MKSLNKDNIVFWFYRQWGDNKEKWYPQNLIEKKKGLAVPSVRLKAAEYECLSESPSTSDHSMPSPPWYGNAEQLPSIL